MTASGTPVALVTGASRGIGLLIVQHFIKRGYFVIGFSRSPHELPCSEYRHYEVDVSDAASVKRAFTSIAKEQGRVDVLVNNASVLTSQYAMILPPANADAMVSINLLGAFYVAREAARLMSKQKQGRIINISSMAVCLEPEGDSIYAATKAGSETMTNTLAKELARYNITCNSLAVSAFQTDMLDRLPRDKIESVVAGLTLPRFASEDDILNVIDFFVSERSSYITAQTIHLGGVH